MSYQQEAVHEWTWVYGAEHPEHEWISSPFDSWEKNPHYTGPKGRHPEDDYEDEVPATTAPHRTIEDDYIPF